MFAGMLRLHCRLIVAGSYGFGCRRYGYCCRRWQGGRFFHRLGWLRLNRFHLVRLIGFRFCWRWFYRLSAGRAEAGFCPYGSITIGTGGGLGHRVILIMCLLQVMQIVRPLMIQALGCLPGCLYWQQVTGCKPALTCRGGSHPLPGVDSAGRVPGVSLSEKSC